MNIPVFHDDQHGTAIISGAGLLNALDISGKSIKNIRLVVSGAGAAAIATSRFYESMGLDKSQIWMFDSRGLIHKGRTDLNPEKTYYAQDKPCTLAEAMSGADVFLGLSAKDILSPEMVKSMGKHPVIFACANPDPRSTTPWPRARPDCIMATAARTIPTRSTTCWASRTFRARSTCAPRSSTSKKIAAANALAKLAKTGTRRGLRRLRRQGAHLRLDYVIPKALDPRVLSRSPRPWPRPPCAPAWPRTAWTWPSTRRIWPPA
jgi:malate dehydrogenase (oxaloacetate-decarboxylating)(NADP+)